MDVTPPCPLCGSEHRYGLDVARSVSLGMAPPGSPAPTRKRSFVRLFACPVKAAQFEATLTLSRDRTRPHRESLGAQPAR